MWETIWEDNYTGLKDQMLYNLSPLEFPGNIISMIPVSNIALNTLEVWKRVWELIKDSIILAKDNTIWSALDWGDNIVENSRNAKSFEEYIIAWFLTHQENPKFQQLLNDHHIWEFVWQEITDLKQSFSLNNRSDFFCLSWWHIERMEDKNIVCTPLIWTPFIFSSEIFSEMHDFFLKNRDIPDADTQPNQNLSSKRKVPHSESEKIKKILSFYCDIEDIKWDESLEVSLVLINRIKKAISLSAWFDSVTISKDQNGKYTLLIVCIDSSIADVIHISLNAMEYLTLEYHNRSSIQGSIWRAFGEIISFVKGSLKSWNDYKSIEKVLIFFQNIKHNTINISVLSPWLKYKIEELEGDYHIFFDEIERLLSPHDAGFWIFDSGISLNSEGWFSVYRFSKWEMIQVIFTEAEFWEIVKFI
jgi:hypothetical protein